MKKSDIFKDELSYIQNASNRVWTVDLVNKLPPYFFQVAASSTGKYHPSFSLGDGGLVRHTQAAVYIAHELLSLEQYQAMFDTDTQDAIISALILHDGWKHGERYGEYTVAEHPVVCAGWIVKESPINDPYSKLVAKLVATHMGQWNTDYKSKKEILPKPETDAQKFVHQCDYIASRKVLDLKLPNFYYAESVSDKIEEIIAEARSKIEHGVDRDRLYEAIQSTCGFRDPRRIADFETADKVLHAVMEVG